MKLNETKTKKREQNLPEGTHEVIFKKFAWFADENQDVKGARIYIDGYRPLYLNYFDEGENFQLDYLLDQLGIEDSYDEEDINEASGTVIKCTRYPKQVKDKLYINTSFNPKPKNENFA